MVKHSQSGGRDVLALQRRSNKEGTSKKARFPARPTGETDLAALRDEIKAKFPKTIARLAE